MILYIKATTKLSSQVFKLFRIFGTSQNSRSSELYNILFSYFWNIFQHILARSKKKKWLQKPCQQVVDILRLHQVCPASLDLYDSMLPRIILLHMSQQTSSKGPFLHALTYTQVSIQQVFSCLSQNGLTKAQLLLFRQRCLIVVQHR